MKIGILQTGRAPCNLQKKHGDYNQMSQTFLGLDDGSVSHYAVLDGDFPDDARDCDVWFVTGSRHGVYEDHDWIAPLEAFLRSARAQNRKIVGVCFGHQIMATAFGGIVEKYSGGLGVGIHNYDLLSEKLDPQPTTLCAYHQDQITTPPKDTKVIATSSFCKYAGLAYGNWGISFQGHPEFTKDYMYDLIKERAGSGLSPKQADKALKSLSAPVGTDVEEMIKSFLRET